MCDGGGGGADGKLVGCIPKWARKTGMLRREISEKTYCVDVNG